MPSVHVPVRASVRDLLRDLFGAPVAVADAEPQELRDERPSYVACYRREDGTVVAAVVADHAAALAMGAALGTVPAGEAADLVEDDGALGEDLSEAFHEVVNVLAKLLNSPTTQHVRLAEVHRVPGDVPRDVAGVVTEPRTRIDWAVEIRGHTRGVLTLVAA